MSTPTSSAPGPRPASDRRKEPRFESKGLADLVVLSPPKFERLTADVVNVSRSGFELDLDEAIGEGSKIEVRLREAIVTGIVSNCRAEAGRYRAGIRTLKVTDSPLRDRHVPDTDFELYARRKSLSEAQREQYGAHLELCASCRKKIPRATRGARKDFAVK
jgi:hypothetical protein